MTAKVQRTWQQRELARLQKIIIAAAEQSKNFSFPTIKEPISLDDISESDDTVYRVFADPKGKSLLEVMNDISTACIKKIHVLVGPEGDLTEEEKKQAQKSSFVFCRLTPTILKSSQAMSILAAACRSL
jgi:16S rRNA (uracil1498-N3)-methyltransferase